MLSDKTLRLRPDPAKGTAKFLHYVLSSRQVRNQIESLLGGSTGQANISQETVAALQVPKVSLSDQARIVDMLDAVTEAEREAQEAITKLRSVRSGIVLSGMASIEATDVPIGWERVTLKEVVPSVDYGISVALNEDARGIPALRMNNLHDGRPDLRDLRYCPQAVHSKHLLRAGDVLFNRTNSIEHVGRAGIWDGELERATFASYLVRLNPDIRRLSPRYLVEWLQHPVIRQRVRSVATVAVQQVNVNPSRLRELVIDLPVDLDEQGKLVASLEMCDHLISVEEENLRKVRVMKQGIIAELLNGKLSHQNV
jgi:type I restriction enzyme S subunit